MVRTLARLSLALGAFALLVLASEQQGSAHEVSSPLAGRAHHLAASPRAASAAAQETVSPLLGNLGTHHHRITTRSELAQRYFDEGLILAYGFNHAEAIRSFRDAATLDPSCAMCYWGIALALGPHINAPMADAAVPEAWAALHRASVLAPSATPAEQAYIEALQARYVPAPVADRAALDRAYADAMRELSRRFPDDLDAATLFAEALMDLTPWEYWTKDGQATQYTPEIVTTLERVLTSNPQHPGANHLYIHAVEASQTPERAVPSAERLETIAPGAGHLVHMAAHVYWRVGRYADAIRINEDAIRADQAYFRSSGAPDLPTHGLYVFGYHPHNIHFIYAGALMSGQSGLALDAARQLTAHVPDAVVRQVPVLADFQPTPLFALVRYGRWEEVLREPRPDDEFQLHLGSWHWARGLAHLRQGQLDQALAEADQLAALRRAAAQEDSPLFSRTTVGTLLALAEQVLAGELAGARGDTTAWISHLERAAAIQDDLPYMEPPSWFYPVRQTLGAALLRLGRAAEAEAVYREDLRQYPDNGWSYYGLAQVLRAQGREAEAAEVQRRFEAAWQHADIAITSSSF